MRTALNLLTSRAVAGRGSVSAARASIGRAAVPGIFDDCDGFHKSTLIHRWCRLAMSAADAAGKICPSDRPEPGIFLSDRLELRNEAVPHAFERDSLRHL